jgi:hypothetical protein
MNTAGSGLPDAIENLPVLSLNPETALSDRNASPYGATNLLFQKSRTQSLERFFRALLCMEANNVGKIRARF